MPIHPPSDPEEMNKINAEIEKELNEYLKDRKVKRGKIKKKKKRTDKAFYFQMGVLLIVLLLYKTLPLFITVFGK